MERPVSIILILSLSLVAQHAPNNTFFATWREQREGAFSAGVPEGGRPRAGCIAQRGSIPGSTSGRSRRSAAFASSLAIRISAAAGTVGCHVARRRA